LPASRKRQSIRDDVVIQIQSHSFSLNLVNRPLLPHMVYCTSITVLSLIFFFNYRLPTSFMDLTVPHMMNHTHAKDNGCNHDLRAVIIEAGRPPTTIRSSPNIQPRPVILLLDNYSIQWFIAFYGCYSWYLFLSLERSNISISPSSRLTATWRNRYRLSGGPPKVHHRPPSARPTWSFLTVRNLERVFPEKVSIT
jgi:hypothetical protein